MPRQPELPPSLTPEDLARVEKSLQVLARLPQEFDKREACGVDCQSYRQLAAELQRDFEAIKDAFTPGRPRRRK